jgi:hypothetical protein
MRTAPTGHDISKEAQTNNSAPETWFPLQELARRQRLLEDLRDRRIAQLPIASLIADTGARHLEP